MSEGSVYISKNMKEVPVLSTMTNIEFVQLKGYFIHENEQNATNLKSDENNIVETYICIDQKLLKFRFNCSTGKLDYSSQIVIKTASEGYSEVVKTDQRLFLVLNPSFNPKVINLT